MSELKASEVTVVLVHGGFVDGAGWEGVYGLLKKDGYNVSIVQNPTLNLAGDVAATRQVIAQAKGPVVLVGHSYGGVVITEAGNDPKVAKLVYIAAFAPDKGESVASLIKDPAPGAPVPPILPRRTASCSSTKRNLLPRLRATLKPIGRRSWQTRKFHGASVRWKARSVNPRGRRSQAGIWSRPTTE